MSNQPAWPRVSVAMATYNGAEFLREQLDTISRQSRPPFELVVCDDGSTDGTVAVIEAFAVEALFPVRLERNPERLGYVRNFRRAASLCSGDLIAFCDQDDRWHRAKLERLVPVFDDPAVLLAYHNAQIVSETGGPAGLLYDAAEERAALDRTRMTPWHHSYGLVQIFRSELREHDRWWDLSINPHTDRLDILAHDQWYFFLAEAMGSVTFVDEVLVDYRQHGANSVGAVQKRPTIASRLRDRLEHYGRQDERAAAAAEARAQILRHLAEERPVDAQRLLAIAERYAVLAQRHHRRAMTYGGTNGIVRLAHLLHSWRSGDYADWPWGFDKRSVLRDAWSGVLLGKMNEPEV